MDAHRQFEGAAGSYGGGRLFSIIGRINLSLRTTFFHPRRLKEYNRRIVGPLACQLDNFSTSLRAGAKP
jgi:hypothetical protein